MELPFQPTKPTLKFVVANKCDKNTMNQEVMIEMIKVLRLFLASIQNVSSIDVAEKW